MVGPGPRTFWKVGLHPPGCSGQSSSLLLDSALHSSASSCPRLSLPLPYELSETGPHTAFVSVFQHGVWHTGSVREHLLSQARISWGAGALGYPLKLLHDMEVRAGETQSSKEG